MQKNKLFLLKKGVSVEAALRFGKKIGVASNKLPPP
jgi:hypothetical protein